MGRNSAGLIPYRVARFVHWKPRPRQLAGRACFVVSPAGNLVPTRLGGRSSLKICRPYLSALAVRSMRRIRRKVDAGQRRKRVARASGLELWQANFAGECRAKGLSSGPPVGSALTERRSRWPRPARRTPCGQPNRPTRSTPSRLCHRSPARSCWAFAAAHLAWGSSPSLP